ncbi:MULTISPECIES: CrcB family protein [unclassified Corynebacterium]|uniref:FluC/FEX family fluoride channel n=1 Tax=unclassified Corynebacterium TaxID=2624378 RepID=UPI0029C9BAF7|nr:MULTISPECIES: CrcB family protein [unclassified Corynebacterium]WPF65736.1 CrcB family protein [Corynebacterium sp. 22KM0430]WPF68231.1 CrcB family protein [Corynebacterium sp. 21KM1197]
MISLFLAVSVGGFFGGAGRYLLGRYPGGWRGTWCANVLACIILALSLHHGGLMAAAWGTGVAGALSTWSTLAAEVGRALVGGDSPRRRQAALYLGATLCAGCGVIALLA